MDLPPGVSAERTILARAQHIVDRWRGSPMRDSFELMLTRALY